MHKMLSPLDLVGRAKFHVGAALAEPANRALSGPHGVVYLEPLAMQLLVVLAEHSGEVVTREGLGERCWGNPYVGDDALNRAIGAVRRGLRDSGADDGLIETIPRTGYRLKAPEPPIEPLPNVEADAAASPASPHRRGLLVGGLTMALIAAAGLPWWRGTWRGTWRGARRDARIDRLIAESENAMRLAVPAADQQGAGFLREALALAPDDAELWGRLALAERNVAEYSPPAAVGAMLQQVDRTAGEALSRDPQQPDALAARALLLPVFGNWARAIDALQTILGDHPDHLPSLNGLALAQSSAGLLALSYPVRLKTVTADPLHAGYNFRSIFAHWMNGNVAAADRAGERGLELWPRHLGTWLARNLVFQGTNRPDRALAMLDDKQARPTLTPAILREMRAVAVALETKDKRLRDQAVDGQMRLVINGGPLMSVMASSNLVLLGAIDHVFELSQGYLLERGPLMMETSWKEGRILHNDLRRRATNYLFLPLNAPMQADPRFGRLMQDIGLADFWRATGLTPDYLGSRRLP